MKDRNEVEVIIAGQVYKLISEESPEHIEKVARYINKKIDETRKTGSVPTINSYLNFLHITINVADDCVKALDKFEKMEQEIEAFKMRTAALESENHIFKQKINLLKEEINQKERELEDYINTFDHDKKKGV